MEELSLGDFRVSQNVHGDTLLLMKSSSNWFNFIRQLRNKSLNVVVNVTSGTTLNAKGIYNSNNVVVMVVVIKQGGSRIIIHVETIQSVRGDGENATTPALDTGTGERQEL